MEAAGRKGEEGEVDRRGEEGAMVGEEATVSGRAMGNEG